MCCRYVLLQEHAKSLLAQLGVLLEAGAPLPSSRYNIPPGGRIPAVRARSDSSRELISLHWGLTPSWARDRTDPPPATNARSETLGEKPTFRDAVRTRRCLIPASGFYEWKVFGRARQPWLFRLLDERPFAFAGLSETWLAPDGTVHESCALVTTAPNAVMEPVHHRMPVLLAEPAAWDAWLDLRITSLDTLAPLFRPFPAARMTALEVGPRVNNTRDDSPDCLIDAATAAAAEPQFSLGL